VYGHKDIGLIAIQFGRILWQHFDIVALLAQHVCYPAGDLQVQLDFLQAIGAHSAAIELPMSSDETNARIPWLEASEPVGNCGHFRDSQKCQQPKGKKQRYPDDVDHYSDWRSPFGHLLPLTSCPRFLLLSTLAKRDWPAGLSRLDNRQHYARGDDLPALAKMPIAILINQSSASASEIVAGALRDHRRAILVGEHSYGKGSVQTVIPMKGDTAALKLTTARYYTPSDKPILTKKGIDPDVKVEMTFEQLRRMAQYQREEHLRENKQKADKAQPKPAKEAGKADEAKDGDAKEVLTWENADPQLTRAVDVLRVGRIFYDRLTTDGK